MQQGPNIQLYATWDIANPPQGTWKLTETDAGALDASTIEGSLRVSAGSVPQLPPEGQVTVLSNSCGIVTCSASFAVSVSKGAKVPIAQYQWFDDNGQPHTPDANGVITMTSNPLHDQYRMIVLTTGNNGEHRFTTSTFQCPCRDGSGPTG